jgi:hypothetical protein
LFTRGGPGVYAWDLGDPPKAKTLDHQKYLTLLARAASTILQPFGTTQADLWERIAKGKKPIKQLSLIKE